MKTLLEQFDNSLSELAWSLWTELGVAGTYRKHEGRLIGLEELIILTSVIAESDPRLRDEALDWCSRFHHFVSISRLRTIIKSLGDSVYLPFSIFASTLNSITHSNWPIYADVLPLAFKPSGKSSAPCFERPALLGLRLRSLFGVGARADLLTFLLTSNNTIITASDAVEIGYSKRSLADLLDNLVESGLFNTSVVRNQRKFELVKKEELKRLVGELPKIAPPWYRILNALISLRNTVQQFKTNSMTTNVVIMRNSLVHLQDILPYINSPLPTIESDLSTLAKWLLEMTNELLHGKFQGHFEVSDDFEKIVLYLMQDLYRVDDCLDGLEFIADCPQKDLVKHALVFREGYQLCLSYLNELDVALQKLLEFPFHQLGDVKLSEIAYQFSKNNRIPEIALKFPVLNLISNPRAALKQYEILKEELVKVREFLWSFQEQLKKIYFMKTDIHLLTNSPKLYKRHLVLKLFS